MGTTRSQLVTLNPEAIGLMKTGFVGSIYMNIDSHKLAEDQPDNQLNANSKYTSVMKNVYYHIIFHIRVPKSTYAQLQNREFSIQNLIYKIGILNTSCWLLFLSFQAACFPSSLDNETKCAARCSEVPYTSGEPLNNAEHILQSNPYGQILRWVRMVPPES